MELDFALSMLMIMYLHVWNSLTQSEVSSWCGLVVSALDFQD